MIKSTNASTIITPRLIQLVYIDDNPDDLIDLQEYYNHELSMKCNLDVTINITTFQDHLEASKYVDKNHENIDIIVCDQNMDRQGLSLITEYFSPNYKNIVYMIYSGASAKGLEEDCKKHSIPCYRKPNKEKLISGIEKLYAQEKDTNLALEINSDRPDDIYIQFAKDLIEDLKYSPPDLIYYEGNKGYNIEELTHEIRTKSDVGLTYVKNFIDGLKLYKTLKR